MVERWRIRRIKEIAEIFDGPHATPHKREKGPWFLSISSLQSGRLVLSESAHLSEEDFAKWTRRVTPRSGDVLFSYETRLGEAALMPAGISACLGRRMGLLRPREGEVDSRFLLYAYLSPDFQTEIDKRAIRGATVDRIPLNELGDWSILVPDLPIQRAIADVLGALDDKIEANRRSVASAQLLANTLFTKWRHDLDAQETTTFGEVANVYGGSTPKTGEAEYWNGNHAWAVPRDVTALGAPYLFDTERHITDLGLASIGNRLHPPGSIFMTSRATIGAFAIPQRPCAVNQGFIVVVPKNPRFRWFLFHEMRSRVEEMLELANGSTFLEISRGNFKNMATILPANADLEALDRRLAPLHEWCVSTVHESAQLAQLRDFLLPLLLSGELRIRGAEALVEEAL